MTVSADPKRILIRMPNWVGDCVMATPALDRIRRRFPNAHIALAAKGYVTKVLKDGPWADEVIEIPGESGLVALAASARRLRRRRFCMAILLTNSLGSAVAARLAGIRVVLGYARDGRTFLLTDRLRAPRENGRHKPTPMPEYYGAIADYLKCPAGDGKLTLCTGKSDEEAADAIIKECRLDSSRPLAALNPGAAFGAAKCWPPEYFAAAGDALVRDYGMQVIVLCGPNEKRTANRIVSLMAEPAAGFDRFEISLDVLKAIVKRLSLLVTNDSGLRHFAAAFDVPSVTMFGPTDPVWADTGYEKGKDLWVDVECGPCQQRVCSRGHECMRLLKPNMVLKAAGELLRRFGKIPA